MQWHCESVNALFYLCREFKKERKKNSGTEKSANKPHLRDAKAYGWHRTHIWLCVWIACFGVRVWNRLPWKCNDDQKRRGELKKKKKGNSPTDVLWAWRAEDVCVHCVCHGEVPIACVSGRDGLGAGGRGRGGCRLRLALLPASPIVCCSGSWAAFSFLRTEVLCV